MLHDKLKGRRLFFISVLFMVLLNFPLLSIFDSADTLAGVPVLYVYLTIVWLACIRAIAFFMNRQHPKKVKK